ncbi:MAG TPA: N-acetylmuramoyl-L-alanine amidase [Candidatus Acidoferrales bacterium]|nr:N-acetylmuramoyl-L-alanine amidase [Candidatus Acidoferrales bacterium]
MAHTSNAQQPAQQSQPQQNPTQQAVTPPQANESLRTVVLDAAHGGTDSGARGPGGVAEKDIVLELAQAIASSLRAQGFQVVMTRESDADPAFDDRAQTANAQTDAIFISLHVGSSGPPGSLRTYTYLFPSPNVGASDVQGNAAQTAAQMSAASGFLLWREAQKPYLTQSGKLGDLIQVELADKFKGSPNVSRGAPVYQLRSIAEPAVALEISNIAMDRAKLEALIPDLASGITRAVMAYKTIYPPGGK